MVAPLDLDQETVVPAESKGVTSQGLVVVFGSPFVYLPIEPMEPDVDPVPCKDMLNLGGPLAEVIDEGLVD